MKHLKILLALWLSMSLSAFSQSIILSPRNVLSINAVSYNDLFMLDGPGESRVRPWFDKLGHLVFILSHGKQWSFDGSLKGCLEKPVSIEPYYNGGTIMESAQISGFWMYGKLLLTRIAETDVEISIPHPDKEDAILAWERLLLVGDRSGSGVVYRGFLFDDDGSYRVLENAEVVPWLLGQSKAFSYNSGVLYYGDSNLTGPHSGFDDDLNLYRGPAMFPATGGYVKFDGFTSEQGFQFDYEGNYWGIGWTEDEAKHPILYYAGRDWGYREPPKKAVTTEAGLRIRLRASTEAFVLGSLGKGEAITIIKTGETATLGGVTAPWYRIKKADGLIGWAFGGYIKVIE